jgi:D-serine deaminase-like pyridoxal phosphate-dependent protein
MLTSLVGQSLDALDTPALIVDIDALDRNIATMTAFLHQRGVQWRPHAKAHKSPAVAHRVIAAGAIGITCAKLSEAEVYAAAGIDHILIANQVVGEIKTRRLAELAREVDVIVAVDALAHVEAIDRAAAIAGSRPGVVIEVDCGMQRAGVAPDAAVSLAERIVALPNVRFRGMMTWEGHAVAIADHADRERTIREAIGRFLTAVEAVRSAGIEVEIVSCGGTGTFLTTATLAGVTEVQAGGGIFGDRMYRDLDVPLEPALQVMVSVTSRPTPTRALIDAGRKTIDPTACPPRLAGRDDATSIALSAEHGTITFTGDTASPAIADRLRLEVGYSDQLVHLHEAIHAVRDGRIVAIWPTSARGRLQ